MITFVSASVLGVTLFLISNQLKISAIVLLLVGGILAGPEFLGLVQPQTLGQGLKAIIALAVGLILFEGGLTLDVKEYKHVSKEIWGVLTKGVLVTWLVSAVVIKLIFGFTWTFCLLAASLIIVTGPTVIGPLLQRVGVKRNLHQILYWEGVLIDPIGVFIALLCYEWILSQARPEAVANFFLRFFIGTLIGLVMGLLLYQILKRKWIQEQSINIFVLAGAMLTFILADSVISEAGLLSVTIAGFVLGYKQLPNLYKVVNYKVELKNFLIGLLFILLAANLKLDRFLDYGWLLLAGVLAVMLIVRPLNIFVSTYKSGLILREKLFLSWIAPRGIVSASMASLFSFQLAQFGVVEAGFLETFTYGVIAGTVILQGFSASWVAGLLKVKERERRDWLIIGAHNIARKVAAFLEDQGVTAMLVDTNPREVRKAKNLQLKAYLEDALQVRGDQYPDLLRVGNILAITENRDLNLLASQRWKRLLPKANRYVWLGEDFPGQNERDLPGVPVWSGLALKDFIHQEIQVEVVHDRLTKELLQTMESGQNGLFCSTCFPLVIKSAGRFRVVPPSSEETEATMLLLKTGQFIKGFPAKEEWMMLSRETVLEKLYIKMLERIMDDFPNLDKKTILADLLSREEEFSSIIGHGIALPHCYSKDVNESLLILAKQEVPLYSRFSDTEIALVFMIISPVDRPDAHLGLISRIAKLVIQEQNRNELLAAKSPFELFQVLQK
ncbi:cation:proton antiporter [bacterium]|nr:cation:proton antiporter [bacterium]